MTEEAFRGTFSLFLDRYWGAFHEVLEAQSVTETRLAASLFNDLLAEHRAFERVYSGPAKDAVERLGRIWQKVGTCRLEWPDSPLTHDEAFTARRLFERIFDTLVAEGQAFPAVLDALLGRAPHGTPRAPLRADTAR